MDSRGRCGAMLSFYPRPGQTIVAYARFTFLLQHFICYHDKLAGRFRCVRAYHWMGRSLRRYYFAGVWQGCRSGKISLVAVISKDMLLLPYLHVTVDTII